MPFSSVPCQKCNGTIACCKSLTHLTHLIKLYFLCSECQMPNIIAFNTFNTFATDALREKKIQNLFKTYPFTVFGICLSHCKERR